MKQTAVEWLEQFIEPDSKQLTTVLTILKEIERDRKATDNRCVLRRRSRRRSRRILQQNL